MNPRIAKRVARIRTEMRKKKMDSMLVTNVANVTWVSGFTGDSSALFLTMKSAHLITDFRFIEQAEDDCPGWDIIMRKKGIIAEVVKIVEKQKLKAVAAELGVLTYIDAKKMSDDLKMELKDCFGMLNEVRSIKDEQEIASIKEAVVAAEKTLTHIKKFLVPGIRERDIAAEIEYYVRILGYRGPSFPPIVAFGARTSLPHAVPTDQRMKPGDTITIDWGVIGPGGYASDLTRCFFHNKIPARFAKIYKIVLEAQNRAIKKSRVGVAAKAVDAAARDYITKAGYGRRFGHSTGHGLGMNVHEGPWISAGSTHILKKNMVFTVEPGIYLPGFGGVRIEDDVLVTAKGPVVLSTTPKSLNDTIIGD